MLAMSLKRSSSSSVVTYDGTILIVRCLLLLYDKTNEITQSVHVSFISCVSKVSPHFTLERSVETFRYTGFDVVIFRGNGVRFVIFQKLFQLTIKELCAFIPLYFF